MAMMRTSSRRPSCACVSASMGDYRAARGTVLHCTVQCARGMASVEHATRKLARRKEAIWTAMDGALTAMVNVAPLSQKAEARARRAPMCRSERQIAPRGVKKVYGYNAFNGELLSYVYILTTTVITFAGIAFSIFVGQL